VSDDRVRNGWRDAPHVLLDFELNRPSYWPRSFTTSLLVIEEDADGVAETFAKLEAAVGPEIKKAASTAAGGVAGAVVGSVIPGIGTAVGAAVGALAGTLFDEVIDKIKTTLKNDVFKPIPLVMTVTDPGNIRQHPDIGVVRTVTVKEYGAHYEIDYDWHLVD
jgi:hypothetical protein